MDADRVSVKRLRPRMAGEGRTYVYGAEVPTEGLDEVRRQCDLAHRYRNRLVELELERRAAVDAALREASPELAALEVTIGHAARPARDAAGPAAASGLHAEVERLEAAERAARQRRGDAARRAPRTGRATTRSAVRRPDDTSAAALKAARAALKAAWARRRELRAALFASADWQARQAALEERHGYAVRAARAASGLYWGTYGLVEAAAQAFRRGAPPRFLPRALASDRLGVQAQHGLAVPGLLAGEDTRLRLAVRGRPGAVPGSRRAALRREGSLAFRVGSQPNGEPVWARLRLVYHRDLPAAARIKWAYLLRGRRGGQEVWRVAFVLEGEAGAWDGARAPETAPAAGVDVGWRLRPDARGGLRVAVVAGADGAEGELRLSERWLSQMERVDRIRSERARLFDAARDALVIALRAAPPGGPLLDLLRERARARGGSVAQVLSHLGAWRSPGRLAALALAWREVPEAPEARAALEAWRARDRHLWEYEEHLRARLLAQRLDLYRRFAARLAARYSRLALEEIDWRKFHQDRPLEAGEDAATDALRAYVRWGAPGLLHGVLRGRARTVDVDPRQTTMRCHLCGALSGEPERAQVVHACRACGRAWDQDRNAARNLLAAASAGPVAWVLGPLAPAPVWSYDRDRPNRGERRAAAARALAEGSGRPAAVGG